MIPRGKELVLNKGSLVERAAMVMECINSSSYRLRTGVGNVPGEGWLVSLEDDLRVVIPRDVMDYLVKERLIQPQPLP